MCVQEHECIQSRSTRYVGQKPIGSNPYVMIRSRGGSDVLPVCAHTPGKTRPVHTAATASPGRPPRETDTRRLRRGMRRWTREASWAAVSALARGEWAGPCMGGQHSWMLVQLDLLICSPPVLLAQMPASIPSLHEVCLFQRSTTKDLAADTATSSHPIAGEPRPCKQCASFLGRACVVTQIRSCTRGLSCPPPCTTLATVFS